jgi:hypothetical protein
MKSRGALLVVALALVGILTWLLWPSREHPLAALTLGRPQSAAAPARPATVTPRDLAPPEARSALADALNLPTGTIQSDLRVVEDVIDAYRSNFHENPVGTNAEITAALTGRNPLRLALLPPDHPAINLKGELCDRWGRPFFFHQLSGTQMEIRSSGPDRKMWDADDAVLTP